MSCRYSSRHNPDAYGQVKHYYLNPLLKTERLATRLDEDLYYALSDPTGQAIVFADSSGAEAGHVFYDPFGQLHEDTLPFELLDLLRHPLDEVAHLRYDGQRWYDPGFGLYIQPGGGGGFGAFDLPESLGQTPYSRSSLGLEDGSNLNGLTVASHLIGFGKSLGQEIAAARHLDVFGRDIYRYAGRSWIAFEASATSLRANRAAIQATGGEFIDSLSGIRRALRNGSLSNRTFALDIFRYSTAVDEVDNLAISLRSTGSLVREGFYQAKTSVYFSELEIARVARFSKVSLIAIGGVTDAILGGGFQYLDDLSDPYLEGKRGSRVLVSAIGNGSFGIVGGLIGSSLACGPYAPVCAAGGGLVGALTWGLGVQPWVFDQLNLGPAELNLRPLN